MSRICFRYFTLLLVLLGSFALSKEYDANDENYPVYNSSYSNEISQRSFTWLKSAQDMIASPTGRVVAQVAKEILNRSAGNSQVLSLNLTNLLIILLLKMLIFTAGVLGAGHWNGGYGYNYARSASRGFNLGLSDGEDQLITAFLAAQGSGVDDCLYAAACGSPNVAHEYARAAKALLQGLKTFDGNSVNSPRYNDLIILIDKAAYDGLRGLSCNGTRNCDNLL